MNGVVEATNKNVKKIIAKATETYKDWHEKLPFALHAYRTGVQTSTGATPYSLVYGMEVVLPIEVEILSLRVPIEMDGKEFPDPINADIVKKYYAWGYQKKDLSGLKTRKGGFGKKRKKKKRKV